MALDSVAGGCSASMLNAYAAKKHYKGLRQRNLRFIIHIKRGLRSNIKFELRIAKVCTEKK